MRNIMTLIVFAASSLFAHAATEPTESHPVKIEWQQPEKFTDIRPATESKKRYQERVINAFNKIWLDISKDLPAGYQLSITMKDLDLAGDVNPMYRMNQTDVRVVKDIYFPRVKLDYVLTGPQQQEIARGTDVKIQDMSFMSSTGISSMNREFHYEHTMLKRWFEKEIQPKLPQ